MARSKNIYYMKSGLLSQKEVNAIFIQSNNENEKKVKALVEHMLDRLSSFEKDYTIIKRTLDDGDCKPENTLPVTDGVIIHVYEINYYSISEDGQSKYVNVTITPNMFMISTNRSESLQQQSSVYEELVPAMERVHNAFYTNNVTKTLDDAMCIVGNARKYAIDGYLESEELLDNHKTVG